MNPTRGWMLLAAALILVMFTHGCRCSGDAGADAGVWSDAGKNPLPDGGATGTDGGGPDAGLTGVLQHHRNMSRDGLYVDAKMTLASIADLHVDTGFTGSTSGNTYAQPLFMENGPSGKDTLFVATTHNDVYALDAVTGAELWKVTVGVSVPGSELPCGTIDPLGVISTPVLDPQARRLYVAGMFNASGNEPKQQVVSIDIDTHSIVWTVDVAALIPGFIAKVHNQRSALLLLKGVLYVPYSGLDGDCGNYQGWVVAVPVSNHSATTGWRTAAYSGSGIWAPSGAASDGTSVYVATGNTNNRSSEGHPFPTDWNQAQSEAVLKLTPPTPSFSGSAADYFTMSGPGGHDWLYNDTADLDLGSSGVVLFDVPGATPSHLAFAIGKTSHTFLLDRDNLGGMGLGLGTPLTANGMAFGALIAYQTAAKSYVGGHFTLSNSSCSVSGADFAVLEVSHTSPPGLSYAWCAKSGGKTSAIVSTTDGVTDPVVWTYGSRGDETLRAHDGNDGHVLYTSSALPGSSQWNAPIIAKGRVYVAGNGVVTALRVP